MPASNLLKQFKELFTTKEGRSYLMSTHFLGPVANWGIPIAAIGDIYNDPKYISGNLTFALLIYSAIFMRFALRIHPRNLLLFSCHVTNFTCQSIQFMRFVKYTYVDSRMM